MTTVEPTVWEKVSDVAEKIGIAWTVLCGALPGGRFQMGTQTVRAVDMRCFTNLPDAFYDYTKIWLREHASKTWLQYEGESYTFGDVSTRPPPHIPREPPAEPQRRRPQRPRTQPRRPSVVRRARDN